MYVVCGLDISQDMVLGHIYIQPPDVEVWAHIQHTYFLCQLL